MIVIGKMLTQTISHIFLFRQTRQTVTSDFEQFHNDTMYERNSTKSLLQVLKLYANLILLHLDDEERIKNLRFKYKKDIHINTINYPSWPQKHDDFSL